MDSISKIDSITEEYGVDQAATGSAQPEPVVSVRGLLKRYGSLEAVAGIDLEVRRGEIFAFLGPNGAGKTTTVEILEGFQQRTGGQVSVLGHDPATAGGAWRDRVGVVLQESEPEPGLSVRECLAMYAGLYRAPRDADQREVGRLRRSGGDRMLAGVAGGIARCLSADVTLVRIMIAALALFAGAGAALYLVAWLLIPAEGYDQSIAAAWIASRNREGESR
jgi:phage shock protein PspC (stress-responsive transcriptional regulator)